MNNTRKVKLISIVLMVMMCLVAYFSNVLSEPESETTNPQLYSPCGDEYIDPIVTKAPEGLTEGEWDDIQAKIQEARYYPTWNPAAEGYVASNPENQWSIVYDRGAAKVSPNSGEDWSWILTPFGYGYERNILSLNDDPEAFVNENEIEFVYDEDLTSWYINDEKGLEHGFTINAPPQPRTAGNLLFEMNLQTSLTSKIINNDENIIFLDDSGNEILNYGKLLVTDAKGQIIPSELHMFPDTITISVNDANAVYPLTIDPLLITEIKKLTASDGAAGDTFGGDVSLNGDTVVVGAIGDDDMIGSAYIFERNQGGLDNWGEVMKLTASDGIPWDWFGDSVSISGDTVAVGAPQEDSGITTDQGAVYIFERNQGGPNNWGEVAKVLASDGLDGDFFGGAVSIDGDTLVVGAPFDIIGAQNAQGSAYIFYRNQGGPDNWGEVTKLFDLNGITQDRFGNSVSIFGDTVVVGAHGKTIGTIQGQGSAYVFERDSGGPDNWGEIVMLSASDGEEYDSFGDSVSIVNDTIVVGANIDDVGGGMEQGSAYIFERDFGGPDNWGEVTKLIATDGEPGDHFGNSVSISKDTVLVGAFLNDIGTNQNQGSVYVFQRNEGGSNNWGYSTNVTASDGEGGDLFGRSVFISGDTFIIGAYYDNVSGNDRQGSAYIYYLGSSNNIPIITTSDITTTYEDTLYIIDYEADDLDGDELTWSLWTDAGDWLTIGYSVGVLSGTPQNSDVGSWTVNVSVSDGHGGIDFSNFTLEVINTNDAPQITTGNVNSVNADELYSVDYEATDDDQDPLTWTLDTNASWLGIVSSTGVLSGTPDESDEGSYYVNVSVSDGNGGGDFTEFILEVMILNNAPVILTDDIDSAFENTLYSVDYEASDEDSDPLTWALDTNASWLSLDSSSGILSGTPSESHAGIYSVKVTVSDGNSGIDISEFTLTVYLDNDGDGITDSDDIDDDNDGIPDINDDFPEDPSESKDTDSDGTGDNADDDDDDDGVDDNEDDFSLDPAASVDTDEDGKPDDWNVGYDENDSTTGLEVDEDDDDDGVLDVDDKYPLDSSRSGDPKEDEAIDYIPYLVLIIIVVLIIIIIAAAIYKGKSKSEVQVTPVVVPAVSGGTKLVTCPSCKNTFEASSSATTITCPHCGFSGNV